VRPACQPLERERERGGGRGWWRASWAKQAEKGGEKIGFVFLNKFSKAFTKLILNKFLLHKIHTSQK